jgi:hypothetical protein
MFCLHLQTIWATCVIFEKMPAVNNRPKGENLPNLVTLLETAEWQNRRKFVPFFNRF